jgi:hypothetical protein
MCFMAATADSDPLRLEGETPSVQRQLLFIENFGTGTPKVQGQLLFKDTCSRRVSLRDSFCSVLSFVQKHFCSGTALFKDDFCSETTFMHLQLVFRWTTLIFSQLLFSYTA